MPHDCVNSHLGAESRKRDKRARKRTSGVRVSVQRIEIPNAQLLSPREILKRDGEENPEHRELNRGPQFSMSVMWGVNGWEMTDISPLWITVDNLSKALWVTLCISS